MDDFLYFLFVAALAGTVFWQLAAGYLFNENWRPAVFREKNPAMYWLTLLFQFAVLVVVVLYMAPDEDTWRFGSSRFRQEQSATERDSAAISERAARRRAEAFDLHRKAQPAQAIAIYDELLRDSGEDAEILFWRGMAHWKLGDTDAALRDFRRVIDLEPGNLEAHRSADRILSRQKRWDEVLAIWNGYLVGSPRDAEAYFERGGTHFHKGDLAAARADAARACELGKAEACKLAERLGTKQ